MITHLEKETVIKTASLLNDVCFLSMNDFNYFR